MLFRRSWWIFLEYLKLDEWHVIYPGIRCYPPGKGVEVAPLSEYLS